MAATADASKGPLDRIFESLGVWGRWQSIQIGLILSLQSVAAYQLLSIVFIGYQPPFRCQLGSNTTLQYNADNFTSSCNAVISGFNGSYEIRECRNGYEFEAPKQSSIVAEWELVCDEKYLSSLTQTVLIGGQAFGATFLSVLSDKFGRKRIFLLVQWSMLVVSTITIFVPDIIVFTILRFLTGALQQGLIMMGTVLPLEITSIEYRSVIVLITGVIWGLFNGSLALLGYAFQNLSWRYLQIVFTGVSLILLLPNMLYLDESMRWLVANGRGREAQSILKKAAKINKVRMSADDDLTVYFDNWPNATSINAEDDTQTLSEEMETGDSLATAVSFKKPVSKYGCCDILTNRHLRKFMSAMFFIWIVSSFGYFGLSLASDQLAGDRFVNYFLLAVADTPAAIFSFFTMKWFGRRPTCFIFIGLTVLCMAGTVCSTEFVKGAIASKVNTAMAIIGKFGISATFGILFIYTSELFPTTIRGLGCGLASSTSRIGGMVSPFFTLWITYYPLLLPIVLGVSCCVACVLVVFLPETRDKELPQSLQDIEKWFSKKSLADKMDKTKGGSESTVKLLSDFE